MLPSCRVARVALLLSIGLLLATAASGADPSGSSLHVDLHREPASLLNRASRAIYRAFLDHLAARRRSLSAAESLAGEGRSGLVVIRPISFSQGLWIFGGSAAFSAVKVIGLSLLYYVAPEFVETWAPTFG